MKIGILGTGHIGKTLVRKLSAAGHDVKVANSRGPDTIEADVLAFGGRAVTAAEAVADVDVVILSIPLNPPSRDRAADRQRTSRDGRHRHVELLSARDGRIDAIEAGQVESLWVAEQLGRPIVKAWNAIGSDSFARKGKPAGSPDRIAIPVAADREADRKVGMALVEDTGFDAFDAGTLAQTRGGSSLARPAIARTSPARRCRPRWRRPTRRDCPSGATWRSRRSWNGSGTARRTRTRNTSSA